METTLEVLTRAGITLENLRVALATERDKLLDGALLAERDRCASGGVRVIRVSGSGDVLQMTLAVSIDAMDNGGERIVDLMAKCMVDEIIAIYRAKRADQNRT